MSKATERFVVREKVSEVFLQVRKGSGANGYAFMKVVRNITDASKFQTREEADSALKVYTAKLSRKQFKANLELLYGIQVKLGPEFEILPEVEVKRQIHVEKTTRKHGNFITMQDSNSFGG